MTPHEMTSKPSFLRRIVYRNPFYLLSAALMLGGCVTLSNSLSWSPIRTQKLLILIGTLQFYEFILIGLGLYLLHRRKLNYDGTTLLALAAFFLVDVTFLSGEIANAHVSIGLVVSCGLVMLAMAKLAIIFHYISLPVASLTTVLSFVQMFVLLSMGFVFKRLDLHIGQLPAVALYAGWWIVALIPILLSFVHPEKQNWPARHRSVIWLFLVLPLISIIAHLSTSNFVFNVRWYSANLSPQMLGVAIALARCDWHIASRRFRFGCQLVLPMVAMLLSSLSEPNALQFSPVGVLITPLRLAALASVVSFAHAFLCFHAPIFAVLSTGLLSIGLLGASWDAIRINISAFTAWLIDWIDRMRPRTSSHWGIVAVVGSFLSLAMGAMISLRKPPVPPVEAAADRAPSVV